MDFEKKKQTDDNAFLILGKKTVFMWGLFFFGLLTLFFFVGTLVGRGMIRVDLGQNKLALEIAGLTASSNKPSVKELEPTPEDGVDFTFYDVLSKNNKKDPSHLTLPKEKLKDMIQVKQEDDIEEAKAVVEKIDEPTPGKGGHADSDKSTTEKTAKAKTEKHDKSKQDASLKPKTEQTDKLKPESGKTNPTSKSKSETDQNSKIEKSDKNKQDTSLKPILAATDKPSKPDTTDKGKTDTGSKGKSDTAQKNKSESTDKSKSDSAPKQKTDVGDKQKPDSEKSKPDQASKSKNETSQKSKTDSPDKSKTAGNDDKKSGDMKYTIQIASVKTQEDADKIIARLNHLGYSGFCSKIAGKDNITWYRVRVGNYKDKTDAENMLNNIKKDKPGAILVGY